MKRWESNSRNFGTIFSIIPVLSLIEHVVRPLLVEGAAHAAVGGEHGEDASTVQWPPFPRTPLQHS